MEIPADVTYRIILSSFLMPIIVSVILVIFIIKYQKRKNLYELDLKDQKIREQKILIESQVALQEERNRIAAEMHDDLGGGLTSIRFIGQKALSSTSEETSKEDLEKIVDHAEALVSNMSEIIWAMNTGFDDINTLVVYMRRYTYEFLEDFEIEIDFSAKKASQKVTISGMKRRHIFLILKELLHNVVKHSSASKINITLTIKDGFSMSLKDNGVGFDTSENTSGNGLVNIKKRVEKLNGEVLFSNNQGLLVNLSIPL